MMRLSVVAASVALLVSACAPKAVPAPKVVTYEVTAIRYATLPAFSVASLVAGADRTRKMDLAMMVWLVKGSNGRTVLVDAGFYRDRLVQAKKPTNYMRPSVAVAGAGVKPEDVTDILVSHVHWDHMDGLDLFPQAHIWIQRAEYEYYVDTTGKRRNSTIEVEDAAMLYQLKVAGRVTLIEGDAQEIMPGITAYTGGKHTFASQYFGVRMQGATAVVASDNVYLYENLEKHAAIGQTLDAASNLAAQDRMKTIASDPRLIVPGHDPAVFERFPQPGNGIARIRLPAGPGK